MILLAHVLSVLFLPFVLSYFIPIQPYFQSHSVFPFLTQGYRLRPVVDLTQRNKLYPGVAGDANVIDPLERMYNAYYNPYASSYPFLWKGDQSDRSEIEGKALGGFLNKNIFKKVSSLDFTFNKERENSKVAKCREKFGGTLVNDECYKYYHEEKTFEDARKFCQEKGGDLWTPPANDTFLYYKLGLLMPEYALAKDDDLWIGVYDKSVGGVVKAITVDDQDITNSFLINVDDDVGEGGCVALYFDYGGLVVFSKSCTSPEEFVCEFNLNPKKQQPVWMFNKFGLFNKKLMFKNKGT